MELTSEFNDLKNIFNENPFIIAGPCSAETEEQMMRTAKGLVNIGVKMMRAGIWKPRTRPGGFEGAGNKGLEWYQEVKKETGIQLATEVATPEHFEAALKAGIDLFWIGARTTCDPFSVQALADAMKGTDVSVLVKNPLCPDLKLWIGAIERIHDAGITKLGAIHRGFCPYHECQYRNEPLWEVAEKLHSLIPNLPLVFDPSHMGGKREYVEPLSKKALDMNIYNGFLIETHCNPDEAWTDACQQLSPASLQETLHHLGIRTL